MNKIRILAEKNRNDISQYLAEKNYQALMTFFANHSGMSNVKLAALFRCDRHSLRRYLSGERLVPMSIVGIMLKHMGISYNAKVENKETEPDCNENGSLIWYGNNELLVNTLYFYRTLEWELSKFEMACKLNIQESTLSEYEHGKKRIPPLVVKQILQTFSISLTDLFPTLVSYDGGKTYLQLNIRCTLTFGGKQYDILYDELYIGPNDEFINLMPEWPTWRYDEYTKPLLKYMPNELTMDEYYNTDSLYFMKDEEGNCFYEAGDFSKKKLPPSYQYLQDFYNEIAYPGETELFTLHISYCNFLDNYKVSISLGSKPTEFDLADYVFSDSIWYQMLQDQEIFKQGKLKSYHGSNLAAESYISWPDGQFINIAELYISKYKYRHYRRASYMMYNNRLQYI